MIPLDLDPAGYGGTYKLVGGRLALDLINTISWPGTEREHDWLSSPANLDRWLDGNDLPYGPAASDLDLDLTRTIRRDLDLVIRPLAEGQRPSLEVVEQLNLHLATAAPRRVIDPDGLGWIWTTSATAVDRLAPAIVDAANIVTEPRHGRLRTCDGCQWLFQDDSRNGQRRWCDMADCGSRAKSRDYYHRHKR